MNFIVAVDNKYGIGKNGGLLCHIPEDLKRFKETTLGKVVVMGRGTLESLPGQKPLPGRTNIVLSATLGQRQGCKICPDLKSLARLLQQYNSDDIFIIGGASVYRALMPCCLHGFITKLRGDFSADVFIDNVHASPDWKKVWESETFYHNQIGYQFSEYVNTCVQKLETI